MSIGYEDLRTNDFLNYWSGCLLFHLSPEEATAWIINHVTTENDQPLQADTEIWLRSMEDSGPRQVTPEELFYSPQWIMYRLPLTYLTPDGQSLYRVVDHQVSRRMSKGTHPNRYTYTSLLDQESFGKGAQVMAALNGDNIPTIDPHSTHVFARAVCNSLRSKLTLKQRLARCFDGKERVVVPNQGRSNLALIRHRTAGNRTIFVLDDGNLIGELTETDGGVKFSAYQTHNLLGTKAQNLRGMAAVYHKGQQAALQVCFGNAIELAYERERGAVG